MSVIKGIPCSKATSREMFSHRQHTETDAMWARWTNLNLYLHVVAKFGSMVHAGMKDARLRRSRVIVPEIH